MADFADKEVAGHEYNWLSSMPRTFGDCNGDGTVDIVMTGSDIYDDYGDEYTIAGAMYFDYDNMNTEEEVGRMPHLRQQSLCVFWYAFTTNSTSTEMVSMT